jgi:hypothetical protein
MKGSSVRQQGLSRLVSVEFTSPDPALSAQVANAMAENFQKISMERRFESSSYARQFLEERLRTVKQRLEASEKELVAYGAARADHQRQSPGMGAGAVSDTSSNSLTAANLSSLNGMLTAAQGERIKAEQRWRQAQSVPPLSLPEAQTDGTIQSLVQRRGTLSATYQEQLRIYAPGMPQMQQLKAQIDETDKQLAAAGANLMAVNPLAVRSRPCVRNESLSGQVERLKGNFMDLRERNIENTILQREVDTNRSLYEGLLQRYKEVGVAGGIAANNISVVDRALPPGGPVLAQAGPEPGHRLPAGPGPGRRRGAVPRDHGRSDPHPGRRGVQAGPHRGRRHPVRRESHHARRPSCRIPGRASAKPMPPRERPCSSRPSKARRPTSWSPAPVPRKASRPPPTPWRDPSPSWACRCCLSTPTCATRRFTACWRSTISAA